MVRLLMAAAAFGLLGSAASAEPEKGPTDPAQFEGSWKIAFPDADGVIVNVPDATCENPAVIEIVGEHDIHVQIQDSDIGVWQVRYFGGKYPWWGDNDTAIMTDWINEDAFLLVVKNPGEIMTDWSRAKQWTRCE